ncbi:hypothetical protein FF38_03173 [Lucilia cuprina]|uniref:Uncharacterized protein n=1 Tax=Lucilia cuprina TaxID=7375 RepID=A0A0L0BP30_LUCCU|nr:hypothetical protein FF38_03173 [Lucilia cuprina]
MFFQAKFSGEELLERLRFCLIGSPSSSFSSEESSSSSDLLLFFDLLPSVGVTTADLRRLRPRVFFFLLSLKSEVSESSLGVTLAISDTLNSSSLACSSSVGGSESNVSHWFLSFTAMATLSQQILQMYCGKKSLMAIDTEGHMVINISATSSSFSLSSLSSLSSSSLSLPSSSSTSSASSPSSSSSLSADFNCFILSNEFSGTITSSGMISSSTSSSTSSTSSISSSSGSTSSASSSSTISSSSSSSLY